MVRFERLYSKKEPLVVPVGICVIVQYQLVLKRVRPIFLRSSLIHVQQISTLETRIEYQISSIIPLFPIIQPWELSRAVTRLYTIGLCLKINSRNINESIGKIILGSGVVRKPAIINIS